MAEGQNKDAPRLSKRMKTVRGKIRPRCSASSATRQAIVAMTTIIPLREDVPHLSAHPGGRPH